MKKLLLLLTFIVSIFSGFGQKYTLVTDQSTLKDNDKIIIVSPNVNYKSYVASSYDDTNKCFNAAEVTLDNDNDLTIPEGVQPLVFTLEKKTDGLVYDFFIKIGDQYVKSINDNTRILLENNKSDNDFFQLSKNSDNTFDIRALNSYCLCYNEEKNNSFFTFYGSTTKQRPFIFLVEDSDNDIEDLLETPTFAINGVTVSGEVDAKVGDVLTISPEDAEILYTLNGNDPTPDLENDENFYEEPFELTETGIFIFKATTLDDEMENFSSVATLIVNVTDGTKESPFTASQVYAGDLNTTGKVWVEGYIIGTMVGSKLSTDLSSAVNTNLVIASSPIASSPTEISEYVPVELPDGKVRTALNLQDNWGNFNQKVKLYGKLENYFSKNGVKNVSDYEIFTPMPVPGKPYVMAKGKLLENGSEVAAGTEIEIFCDNAISLTGFVGDEELEEETIPYKYIVNVETYIYVSGLNNKDEEGEELEMTIFIGETNPDIPEIGSTFKQMKSLEAVDGKYDSLEEGYYMIARNSGQDQVTMSTSINNGAISGSNNFSVESISTGRQDFNLLSTTGNDVLILKLEKRDGNWGLKTVNFDDGLIKSQGYLSAPDPYSSEIAISEEFSPVFISINTQNNIFIKFGSEDNTYNIKYNRNKGFINSPGSSSSDLVLQLYKLTNARNFVAEYDNIVLALNDENISKEIYPNNEEYPANITYSVKGNTTLVQVEGNTVTAKEREGQAALWAEWPEDDEWFGGRTELAVYVKKILTLDDFYFRHAKVKGKKNVGVVSQAVYYAGTGTVRYYTSDPNELVINEETGMIRSEDIANAEINKEYTVYAEVTETDEHMSGITSYTVIIEAPDEGRLGGETVSLTENFGNNENKEFNTTTNWSITLPTSYNSKESNHTSLNTGITYTIANCMVQNDSKEYFLQFDGGEGTMSFIIPENCVSIEYLAGTGMSSKVNAYFQIDNGEKVKGMDVQAKGTAKYVLPPYNKNARMTISSDYALRIASLTFIIGTVDESTMANLSFNDDDRIVNITAETETTLPVLSHNELLNFDELMFDIDEINEKDDDETYVNYVITSNDFNDIRVMVNEPGVYTFRAYYEGEKFSNGMALLRLNVFPRLSVAPNVESDLASDKRTDAPELTLVHSTPNEEGVETATISLPSLDELNNSLKYSTVSLSQIEIKHGSEIHRYTMSSDSDTPENVRAKVVNEEVVNEHNVDEFPSTFDFVNDGYVKYTLVYANTPDFSIEEKVNVVLMPTVPTYTNDGPAYTFTPSQNAVFYYYTTPSVGLRTLAENDAAQWGCGEQRDAQVTVTRPNDLESSVMFAITYKSVKDISDIVKSIDRINDTTPLESETSTIVIDGNGVVSGVEDVTVGNDGDAVYYNLQGIRMTEPLTPGIYIRREGTSVSKVVRP